jgi:glycosyltransferase involved in cell wall biosynthesis
MQVSEINTLEQLLKNGHDAVLYAKKVMGFHQNIREIPYMPHDKIFNDISYYTRFMDLNKDYDIYQGNSTPLLTLFKPQQTIIRINGNFPFPHSNEQIVQNSYNKAWYYFVSQFMMDTFYLKYPFFDKEKCFVIHNAVDNIEYPNKNSGDVIRFLFASRWVEEKGLFVLLEAITKLNKRNKKYIVYIAGGLQQASETNDYFNGIENNITEKLKKIKNVHILGYLKNSDLLKKMNDIDVLLFPSLYGEPFSSLPLQAAIAKIPTIAFDTGSLSESVLHNQTGILLKKSKFNFKNSQLLADAIDLFIDNPLLCKELGEQARMHVIENFMWDSHIKKLTSVYEKMIS